MVTTGYQPLGLNMSDDYRLPYAALRAFDAIGRTGGIRRAASKLGVSHAIVSRHLKGLELALGTLLVVRQSGDLTDAGRVFHLRIRKAIAEIDDATRFMRDRHGSQLVIGCAPGLAVQWLTKRLPTFRSNSGRLIVTLNATDRIPDLSSNEADGDIRYVRDDLAVRSRDTRFVTLSRPEVFPVAAPKLAAQLRHRVLSVQDLEFAPLIEEHDGAEWEIWFAAQGCSAVSWSPIARYGHAHLAIEAARAGQGIALGNRFLVSEDIAAGRLVPFLPASENVTPVALGAYVFQASAARWDDVALTRFRMWIKRQFTQNETQA